MDKTGTITKGQPSVTDIVVTNAVKDEAELLQLAASVEKASEHPLGEAIVAEAGERDLVLSEISRFEAVVGQGVSAEVDGRQVWIGNKRMMESKQIDLSMYDANITRLQEAGKTAMLVAVNGKLAGIIAVADTIKPGSAEAIQKLRSMKLEVVMLTGDNKQTAMAIAKQAGVDRVLAEVITGR